MSIRMLEEECRFHSASPIWIKDAEEEVNITCGFYTAIPRGTDQTVLRIAAASLYHLYINGQFICLGPVRTAHGYHRMDAIDITNLLTKDFNHIAIEVWNPNRHCFAWVKAPAFLQAEVESDGKIIATTADGNCSFTAVRLNHRIRNVQNYSFQRAQAESYRLSPSDHLWREGNFQFHTSQPLRKAEAKNILSRSLPAHTYHLAPLNNIIDGGTASGGVCPVNRSVRSEYAQELDLYLTDDAQTFRYTSENLTGLLPRTLEKDRYLILDAGREISGLITLSFNCCEPSVITLEWDELLTNRTVSADRLATASVITLQVQPGEYLFRSFDVYSLKYLQVKCTQGCVTLNSAGILEYRYPLPTPTTSGVADPVLEKIWQAARETFCQNASDIFMDCPHRERAGWLCDSYFIGRTEYALTGKCRMERLFLENFLLPESFEFLPKGMLPMCYPSDHADGNYIPNWAMWYVIELADYVKRSGDKSLADLAKERVYELIHFFRQYLNEFGLLEKLDRWVFVEWSMANKFVQDVNFPSNMLYAGMLRAAGQLYGDNALRAQAETVLETVRDMAYDGTFFIDNAIRGEDGKLHLTRNRTETCQYYAFYFQAATPETHRDLWNRLATEFGPHRAELGLWPEIHPSNAFIGNYLRLDLLASQGLHSQCLEETKGYFEYMADTTGTLWEHKNTEASCNHGFASYYIFLLKQIIK